MRRTKEEAEQTRNAILEAAVDVFTEKGVARATLEQIAKAANVTRGAVYWHFKNKTDIFMALHDELHRPFVQDLVDGLENANDDPLNHLQSFCVELLSRLEDDLYLRRSLSLFLLKCDYTGSLQVCQERTFEANLEKSAALAKFFEKAQAQGTLSKDLDPKTLTLALSCFVRGIATEYLENPDSFSIRKEAPKLFNVFFRKWN
ncbi:TetR family transcriptional regulator [Alteromonas lipolytica]|uniref:TetR family transcriptional regulator n=1 Tax=Alteromonas lipolytica TaxID=1856405 RepID=A0A1E8FBZ8_9ALTE|nr:TetR family transcriptional regulator [Alteromonas lipolytica]OFI33441.1 TetR family transcriptional regulator [Alteromonas lipolytica]GGF59669.1 TetR family transcriptional regulator [Alteromonas lipolytica]